MMPVTEPGGCPWGDCSTGGGPPLKRLCSSCPPTELPWQHDKIVGIQTRTTGSVQTLQETMVWHSCYLAPIFELLFFLTASKGLSFCLNQSDHLQARGFQSAGKPWLAWCIRNKHFEKIRAFGGGGEIREDTGQRQCGVVV